MKPVGEDRFRIIPERILEALPKCDRHFLGRLDHKFGNFVIKLHELATGPLAEHTYDQCDQTDTSPDCTTHKLRLVKTTAGKCRQMENQFPRHDHEQNRTGKSDDDMIIPAVMILSDRIVVIPLLTPLAPPHKQSQCRRTRWRLCS